MKYLLFITLLSCEIAHGNPCRNALDSKSLALIKLIQYGVDHGYLKVPLSINSVNDLLELSEEMSHFSQTTFAKGLTHLAAKFSPSETDLIQSAIQTAVAQIEENTIQIRMAQKDTAPILDPLTLPPKSLWEDNVVELKMITRSGLPIALFSKNPGWSKPATLVTKTLHRKEEVGKFQNFSNLRALELPSGEIVGMLKHGSNRLASFKFDIETGQLQPEVDQIPKFNGVELVQSNADGSPYILSMQSHLGRTNFQAIDLKSFKPVSREVQVADSLKLIDANFPVVIAANSFLIAYFINLQTGEQRPFELDRALDSQAMTSAGKFLTIRNGEIFVAAVDENLEAKLTPIGLKISPSTSSVEAITFDPKGKGILLIREGALSKYNYHLFDSDRGTSQHILEADLPNDSFAFSGQNSPYDFLAYVQNKSLMVVNLGSGDRLEVPLPHAANSKIRFTGIGANLKIFILDDLAHYYHVELFRNAGDLQ